MATDDRQVLVTGQEPTPATFKVPGNGQIQPKAVFANYDGTAAAVPFLPALKVTSDGGELVGIYPSLNQVAAGGTADVSWAPFLRTDAFQPNTGGLWRSYSPTWGSKSGAQPVLGNGSITGLYFQIGGFVVCRTVLTAGTTTTFGNPGDVWVFSLPITATVASVSFGLSSNSQHAGGDVITWGFQTSTTSMAGWGYTPAGGTGLLQFLTPVQPVTWASGDVVRLASLYEAG